MDVMDGRFVPQITFGTKLVADVRKRTNLPLDIHLMTVEPERLVEGFVHAGADILTFHIEACVHAHRTIQLIRELGAKPGISIVPSTPVSAISEILPFVGLVLVMTVNPGYGGQEMLPFCLRKVMELRKHRDKERLDFLISIDGGVGPSTFEQIAAARPDALVMGSAFFGTKNPLAIMAEAKAAYEKKCDSQ
jgi:ribulose-phosphate 3-epimerase